MLSWAGSTFWQRELGVCFVDGVRDVGAGDAVGAESCPCRSAIWLRS